MTADLRHLVAQALADHEQQGLDLDADQYPVEKFLCCADAVLAVIEKEPRPSPGDLERRFREAQNASAGYALLEYEHGVRYDWAEGGTDDVPFPSRADAEAEIALDRPWRKLIVRSRIRPVPPYGPWLIVAEPEGAAVDQLARMDTPARMTPSFAEWLSDEPKCSECGGRPKRGLIKSEDGETRQCQGCYEDLARGPMPDDGSAL